MSTQGPPLEFDADGSLTLRDQPEPRQLIARSAQLIARLTAYARNVGRAPSPTLESLWRDMVLLASAAQGLASVAAIARSPDAPAVQPFTRPGSNSGLPGDIAAILREVVYAWPAPHKRPIKPSTLDRLDRISQHLTYWSTAAAAARPSSSPEAVERTFTIAALRDMTGLGNKALNRYAKAAKLQTPARGARNFKYARADVRAILNTIIASTSEKALLDKCKTALRNLPEIAE